MEFIPRKAPAAAPLDARQRLIRASGIAAVAAALGLTENGESHAHTAQAPAPAPIPIPRAA